MYGCRNAKSEVARAVRTIRVATAIPSKAPKVPRPRPMRLSPPHRPTICAQILSLSYRLLMACYCPCGNRCRQTQPRQVPSKKPAKNSARTVVTSTPGGRTKSVASPIVALAPERRDAARVVSSRPHQLRGTPRSASGARAYDNIRPPGPGALAQVNDWRGRRGCWASPTSR